MTKYFFSQCSRENSQVFDDEKEEKIMSTREYRHISLKQRNRLINPIEEIYHSVHSWADHLIK